MFTLIMNSQRQIKAEAAAGATTGKQRFDLYIDRVQQMREHGICIYQPHWPYSFIEPNLAEYLTLGRACVDGRMQIPDDVTQYLQNQPGEFFIQVIAPYVTLKNPRYFQPCGIPQDSASDKVFQQFYSALADWLTGAGLIERAFVWIDEPPDPNHPTYAGQFEAVARRIERIVKHARSAGIKTCAAFYNQHPMRYWRDRGVVWDRYYLRVDDLDKKPNLRAPGQLQYVPDGAEIGHYWANKRTVASRNDALRIADYAHKHGAVSLLFYSADKYWDRLDWFDGIGQYDDVGIPESNVDLDDVWDEINEIKSRIDEISNLDTELDRMETWLKALEARVLKLEKSMAYHRLDQLNLEINELGRNVKKAFTDAGNLL